MSFLTRVMTLVLVLLVGSTISFSVLATDAEETVDEDGPSLPVAPDGLPNWTPPGTVLYENGELVNSAGTGVGGADESVLQNVSLGMNTLGFGHQAAADNRVADNFTVPAGGWTIDGFVFFAYQTGSSTTSTMTAVNYQIWDGPPGAGGSVIYGDVSTDQMASTEWSGVYRVTETTTGGATNRPIMAQVTTASLGGTLQLPAGTYWVDWQTDGTLGSGPWAPPVSENGVCVTGDGLQSLNDGVTYNPANDSGAGACQQDFPFFILGQGEPVGPARFLVSKDFDDDNTGEVEVTLSCNTGLPLQQTTTISEGDPVNFVINDFEQGALNCTVTEGTPDGYTASYDDGDGVSAVNCSWVDLTAGQYTCAITNTLNQVEVEVTKVWIDENPQFNAQNVANADWSCSNVAFGPNDGLLQFEGNPGVDSFFVYPDWDTGTTCSVTEVILLESGIEVDDSDCQGIVVFPGVDGACTIFNTRLYEGIPTLSQYGLALLALLMLGVGFVAVRRFV